MRYRSLNKKKFYKLEAMIEYIEVTKVSKYQSCENRSYKQKVFRSLKKIEVMSI